MKVHGRPLRFLAIVVLAWVGARAYFISPFSGERGGRDAPQIEPEIAAVTPAQQPQAPAGAPPTPEAVAEATPSRAPRGFTVAIAPPRARPPGRVARGQTFAAGAPPRFVALPVPGAWPEPAPAPAPAYAAAQPAEPPVPPALLAAPEPSRARRLSGYAYAFAREGRGAPALAANFAQLGGSQAGLRLDYALGRDPARGLALTGRVSIPLETRLGREAAAGLAWKPVKGLTFVAERRFALGDGGRDAFAALAYGGVGPVPLPAGFRLEAYGQAGVVGLKRGDVFADGQVTAMRTVTDTGDASLSIGAGVWGGAQPGASRLDVGPRARIAFPLPEGRGIGVAIDYRARVAGDARPGSGVAITLDTSF